MSQRKKIDDTVRQRSGWLIPIGIFVLIASLSLIVLMFYLAPTPASLIEERPSPTSRTQPIAISINGVTFAIPANYIPYKSARHGGPRKDVGLVATYPEFHGYSDWDDRVFISNAADSPSVYMLIREEPLNLTEAERLKRIYLNFVIDQRGTHGPFGLTKYTFRDDSGYRGQDLFVSDNANDPIILRCDRFSRQVRSPSCLGDMPLTHGVAVSYRFKRSRLADWRKISDGVDRLIRSFRTRTN